VQHTIPATESGRSDLRGVASYSKAELSGGLSPWGSAGWGLAGVLRGGGQLHPSPLISRERDVF